MDPLLMITVILLVIAFVVIAKFFVGRKPKLSSQSAKRIAGQWQHAMSLTDPVRRILEADKVVDHLLGELGYKGSMGEKLRRAEKIIPNGNTVWTAHKLRNRLAHEPGASISDQEAKNALHSFEGVFRKFVKE